MSIKICHTADVHLGMKFAGHGEQQEILAEARFKALEKLIERANSESCELLVVAGDLFERVAVGNKAVRQCAEILNGFDGRLSVILPGNHDYYAEESGLWASFKALAGDRILLLEEGRPYALNHYDLNAVLYPAPCMTRHSSSNGLKWMRDIERDGGIAHHIGVVHGTLAGYGRDDGMRYYPMTQGDLDACALDLWLLGHIHVPYPIGPANGERVFYAGALEPDGFDCAHSGNAWIIELDAENQASAVPIETGAFRFVHDEREVLSEADLESLIGEYAGDMCRSMLLKLKLKGRLSQKVHERLRDLRDKLETSLFSLQLDTHEVAIEITRDIIGQEFTQDSFPYRLLSELERGNSDDEALQIAYEMIKEIRE
jgi:DNA repair protein SbcD/Mre11